MAETDKQSPSTASAKEELTANRLRKEDDKKEDEKDEVMKRLDRMESMLGKSVDMIELLDKDNKTLKSENATLKAQIAALRGIKAKDVPPKKDVKSEGSVDHDPTKKEVDVHTSEDAATKSPKDTTPTGGALTSSKVAKELDITALVERAVEARLAKSATPTPMAYPNVPAGQGDVFAFIRKAVEEDRKNCGGSYSGDQSFGVHSGRGNDEARAATAKWFTKQYYG